MQLNLLRQLNRDIFDVLEFLIESPPDVLVEALEEPGPATAGVPDHELVEVGEHSSIEPHDKLLNGRGVVYLAFFNDGDCVVDLGYTLCKGLGDVGVVCRCLWNTFSTTLLFSNINQRECNS